MKTVGVNRAPVRIHHSGRAGDSDCDTFEKKKIRVLNLVVLEHPESGSDSLIGSNRKGVLQLRFHRTFPISNLTPRSRLDFPKPAFSYQESYLRFFFSYFVFPFKIKQK